MSSIKDKILVIAPHQDDETFGCGGFIAQQADRGSMVTVLFITKGWSGINSRSISKLQKAKMREIEAKKAGKILGTKKIIFLRKEDRSIYADKTLLLQIVEIIQKIQPNIIICPHANDADLEHRLVNQLTKEAAWLAKEGALVVKLPQASQLRRMLFYEVWTPIIKPAVCVDITEYIDVKIKAMRQYKSQLQQRNYLDAMLGLNMFRGQMRGFQYGEAFEEKIL